MQVPYDGGLVAGQQWATYLVMTFDPTDHRVTSCQIFMSSVLQ